MTAQQNLIEHLARQIRDYPRDGGPRPDGMLILQRGKKRIPLDKDVPKWSKDTTVPTEVAEILFGIRFDKKKAVASCHRASDAVTQHFGWNLKWMEELKLGGYLISCLAKADYYRLYNQLRSKYKFEWGLQVISDDVRDYPESDPYTSDVPFPPWTGPIDEKGKVLVTPSKDQLKRTVWRPSDDEFKVNDTVGDPPDYIVRALVRHAKEYPEVYGKPTKAQVIIRWKNEGGLGWRLGISRWVLGVNKLESNAYRINQRLVGVVDDLADTVLKEWEETLSGLRKEQNKLKQERKKRKSGWGVDEDGKRQFHWSDFEAKKYEINDAEGNELVVASQRSIQYLDHLWALQKEQDKSRKTKGLKLLKDDNKRRYLKDSQRKVRSEYWRRWYECSHAIEAVQTKQFEFKKTLQHATERLGDKPFYQRAFLDHRGRIYLNKSVIHYQGGDLQRGLVDFAEGKKVRKSDMRCLYIHLANLAGIKGDPDTREIAALTHKKDWLKWGKNPVKYYADWGDLAGDDKFQFLRGCIELAELDKNPNHKSTLICEVDQSTSCLQHVAVLEGDHELARRVNLGSDYRDIYQDIAEGMPELSGLKESQRRKLVKMALVPWTYGGTAWTACQDYHKSDMPYLKNMSASKRSKLATKVIKAIEKELPKAVHFRDEYKAKIDFRWEHTSDRNAIWMTSSGFTVYVYRQETDEERVYIWNGGKEAGEKRDKSVRLVSWQPNSTPDKDEIQKAMPPNFVHSIDAAVMHLVMAYTPKDQSCVGIHDALGTHLRDVKEAQDRFRSAFHYVYSKAHREVMAQGFLEPLPPGQADPTEYERPDETPFIDAEFLAEIAKAPYMTS